MATAVTLSLTMPVVPGYARGPADAPADAPMLAPRDLGAVRGDGVTVTDSLGSFSQANAYTFQVPDRKSSVQVYVGDLWYDVEVLLLQASALPGDAGQWRTIGCSSGSGCVTSAPPSARRRVQFFQPKGLMETLEPGSYAVVVRPRSEDSFDAARRFTLRVAATPPVCASNADAEQQYQLAMAITPERPGRSDLVTFTAYLMPPFGDLFEYEWTVDGHPIPSWGAVAQAPSTELGGGSHEIRVRARGARPYPDPDQADIPPTLTVSCSLTVS